MTSPRMSRQTLTEGKKLITHLGTATTNNNISKNDLLNILTQLYIQTPHYLCQLLH